MDPKLVTALARERNDRRNHQVPSRFCYALLQTLHSLLDGCSPCRRLSRRVSSIWRFDLQERSLGGSLLCSQSQHTTLRYRGHQSQTIINWLLLVRRDLSFHPSALAAYRTFSDSLDVPGLAEKRPSVVLEDKVKVQTRNASDKRWFEGVVIGIQSRRVELLFKQVFQPAAYGSLGHSSTLFGRRLTQWCHSEMLVSMCNSLSTEFLLVVNFKLFKLVSHDPIYSFQPSTLDTMAIPSQTVILPSSRKRSKRTIRSVKRSSQSSTTRVESLLMSYSVLLELVSSLVLGLVTTE